MYTGPIRIISISRIDNAWKRHVDLYFIAPIYETLQFARNIMNIKNA